MDKFNLLKLLLFIKRLHKEKEVTNKTSDTDS